MGTHTAVARHAYRRLLRELALQRTTARAAQLKRDDGVAQARMLLRARQDPVAQPPLTNADTVDPAVPFDARELRSALAASQSAELRAADLDEVTRYLTQQKLYKDLLERYNGTPMDAEERVRLTARRVGLDADFS